MQKRTETRHLGVQTNVGNTAAETERMVQRWQPRWARTYTIENFRHTDYNHHVMEQETGYASFTVVYSA